MRTTGYCLAGAAVLAFTTPAFAHAHLKTAKPAVDGTVATAPNELRLTFSEGVNPKFTGVSLYRPDKAAVATGTATLGPEGDTTLVVPVTATLATGTYTVDWHALATDGHKTSGHYTFTVGLPGASPRP